VFIAVESWRQGTGLVTPACRSLVSRPLDGSGRGLALGTSRVCRGLGSFIGPRWPEGLIELLGSEKSVSGWARPWLVGRGPVVAKQLPAEPADLIAYLALRDPKGPVRPHERISGARSSTVTGNELDRFNKQEVLAQALE